MTKKTLATWGILIVLLVSLFGTAAAQSGTTPATTPTPTTVAGSKFFTHPVVKLLSAYFDREVEDGAVEPTETATPDPLATPDPSVTPAVEEPESGLGPIGEQIAAYHEEGMGFGVLVKIYAMAEAAKAECDAKAAEPTETAADGATDSTTVEEPCTPVTADELVTSFKSGVGMGQLFKEYGKPAMLGVGHVKHAAGQVDEQPTTDDEETVTTDGTTTTQDGAKGQGKTKTHKPAKTNPNKGPKK